MQDGNLSEWVKCEQAVQWPPAPFFIRVDQTAAAFCSSTASNRSQSTVMFISAQTSSLAVRIANILAVTVVLFAGRLLFHASRPTPMSKRRLVLPNVVTYVITL
ncbi:uncharacterized [Tachysurus ichikawai]